ncbi:MAG: hypothetical protein IT270_16380, partial [Saprospiraceae bacterium]|nr:hypothetical protein [Saprospiraceae bacterium]
MFRLGLLCCTLFCIATTYGQIPSVCQPNQNQGSTSCSAACVRCDFDMIQGSTANNILPGGLPPFCGTFENPEWFRFVAGQSEVTFALSTGACAYNEGVEIAFYNGCNELIACFEGPNLSLNEQVSGLIPGREYLVVIDGYNGDLCDYLFHFTSTAMTTAPVPNGTGVT